MTLQLGRAEWLLIVERSESGRDGQNSGMFYHETGE
jgi:hypothetical protein